jgi:hypothetical protein
MPVPEIPEDLTTEEQLRRCREVLASNLCAQGVRALSSEPLTQLIAKVSKIDRRGQHIDALQNYIAQLKSFAIENSCDYTLYSTTTIYADSSLSTAGGPNLTYAYAYFKIPTTFTINGKNVMVPPEDVVLVTWDRIAVDWGTSSTAYFHVYCPVSYSSASFCTDRRKFSDLKSSLDGYNRQTLSMRGTTFSSVTTSYAAFFTANLIRSSNTHYRFYSTPYSTS